MIRARRALAFAVLLMTLPALLIAGRAWACVPIPVLTVLPHPSGPSNSTFSVQGENFPGPVEVRWNSTEGQLLARVDNPTAFTRVRVPSVAPGLYVVTMLSRQADRTVGAIARAPFYVQGSTTAWTKQAAAEDQKGLLLVAVIIGLAVLGVWGLVLLRRGSPRSPRVG
jgi:hypothetical protein